MDADHSGTISRTEFIRGLRDVAGLEFTTDDTNALLHVLDRDHDNTISWHEFAVLYEPSRYVYFYLPVISSLPANTMTRPPSYIIIK